MSFGLKPAARHVLNSMFLYECQKAGLDAAIVHAARILPLNRIPEEQQKVCLDLIYDRRDPATGYDPLQELLAIFDDVEAHTVEKEDRTGWPVERRLEQRIVDGERDGLTAELDEALANGLPALDIVNDVLLAGMKTVGELFGSGQMQLPFVLQSAETMKAAVSHLEPHMEKVEGGSSKGRIVLATVKGDVHDIGKNLVDIILTNNGYEVHNLGIKVPIATMIDKAVEVGADAVGMSGLLVKSTLIMRDNLVELNDRRPVRAAGAPRRRRPRHVPMWNVTCARSTRAASSTARTPSRGCGSWSAWARSSGPAPTTTRRGAGCRPSRRCGRGWPRVMTTSAAGRADLPARSPEVETDNRVFVPPFLGNRIVTGIPLDDIAGYLNLTALFRNQWQYRPEKGETDDQFKNRLRPLLREELAQCKAKDILIPQARLRLLRGQRRRQRPGDLEGRDPLGRVDAVLVPPPARGALPLHRRLLPAGRLGRPRLRRLPHRHAWAPGCRRRRPAVPRRPLQGIPAAARARRRDGRGAGRVLAPAHPRRVGFPRRGRPDLTGLFRQQYRGGRYSWGYPACPDLEDNAKVLELLGGERIGLECDEDTGFQYQPEQTTSAIICHHPKAKYFIAR